jgi:Protein of unknown function (DUF3185)
MPKILSAAALVVGLWLVYLGYEREHSVAGKTDSTLSAIDQRIDGQPHTPTHMVYYASGAVLMIGGAFGLGILRK